MLLLLIEIFHSFPRAIRFYSDMDLLLSVVTRNSLKVKIMKMPLNSGKQCNQMQESTKYLQFLRKVGTTFSSQL